MHAQEVLNATNGQSEYKHTNGEISIVRVDMAGMGTKRVRIANLPPETKEEKLRAVLSQYGDIKDIQKEKWRKAYRYVVDNGIRIVTIILKKHIPSGLVKAGHRVLATYEGQPETCYGCGEAGHVYVVCPHRRRVEQPPQHEPTTWATIAANLPQKQRAVDKEKNIVHNYQSDHNEFREEELINKGIHKDDDTTHCNKTTTEQQNDTGHVPTKNQCKINKIPETTTLVKQKESDPMELSDEDVAGTTTSTTRKDDIQPTDNGKHDRTLRTENQMSRKDEEETYTVILEKTHIQTGQLATTDNPQISPIRLKKLKLDTKEERRQERTRSRTHSTARGKSDSQQE
jgi:ribosomal protein L19E